MKIGVLTLPLKGNYGGVLQAYALLSHLKQAGHDVYLVDRQWDAPANKTIRYRVQKYLFHNVLRRNVKNFCSKWIVPTTERIDNQQHMNQFGKQGFDAIIVGSDQVWRLEHTGGVKNNFFLDFVSNKNTKKISYAASFGKDNVDGDQKELSRVSELLKQFNSISVRETTGVKICKEVFDVDSVQVVDPTLLVDREVYERVLEKKYVKKLKNTLTTYVLDDQPEKIQVIEKVANTLNLTAKSINYKKDPAKLLKGKLNLDFYNYTYPPVENWIRGFRDAEFIVTDSFHGMVFSVIFEKQFIVIGNEKRGLTRFTSFLSALNLNNRLITTTNPYSSEIIDKKINYTDVNIQLTKLKNYSKIFLSEALKEKI
jgi:hypothetical protein